MEFVDVVKKRRSTRRFLQKEVDDSLLKEILEFVARYAPSSRNTHSTSFLVVKDRSILEKMALMRDYGSAFLSLAPAAVVVLGDELKTDLYRENCAISATLLQAAIVDRGLSSCWIHVLDRPREKDNAEAGLAEAYLRDVLKLKDDNLRIECVIALGYADYVPKPLPEFDYQSAVKWL
ncbi:MAG: nitroreductase family protein [Alistipes sp.]|nr:nitroreductase family protein [Candidatus Alistipes equi]